VLPRDRLVSVLHRHIVRGQAEPTSPSSNVRTTYGNVVLNYGYRVVPERIDLLPSDCYGYDEVDDGHDGTTKTTKSAITDDGMMELVLDKRVLVRVEKIISDATTTTEEGEEAGGGDAAVMHYSADLVIAADGSARTFANEMERLDSVDAAATQPRRDDQRRFTVVRYPDDNPRVYKSLPFRMPSTWRRDMNYAVRTDRIIFDALPANGGGDYVGVLLMKDTDDMAKPEVDPGTFRDFLAGEIPQFVDLFDDDAVADAACKPSSALPKFRYVTPRLHHHYRTLLLGDCAHTVKPYFGMGANSALEDVKIFSECIDAAVAADAGGGGTNGNGRQLLRAVREFSKLRSPDIETLVRASHRLDRPGWEGIFAFLIPIILDGIFFKLMPGWFAPNVIAMLQDEEITFQHAVERKRLDRIGQIVILVGTAALAGRVMLTTIVGSQS
jgi:kynurenine 3-monooxygenase